MSEVYGDEKRWWAFEGRLFNRLGRWYELKPRSFELIDVRRAGEFSHPWLRLDRQDVRDLVAALEEWLSTTEDRPT